MDENHANEFNDAFNVPSAGLSGTSLTEQHYETGSDSVQDEEAILICRGLVKKLFAVSRACQC